MRYAFIAAVAGLAAASPIADGEWEPVKTTPKVTTPAEWVPIPTPKCSTTSVYTTKECGDKKDAWDNCKDVTKTTTVYLEKCPATTWAEYYTTTKPADTWAPIPTPSKCSTVSAYTTKECGDKKDAWDNCKDVTKYTTVYLEKCPVTTKPAETWAPVPAPAKCSSTSTYTTKECGDKKDAWDNCKDVTKTTVVYPTVCPTTWAEYTTPAAATTWAPVVVSTSKPVAPASTSSWSPVATFKGAADKQAVGMGALAIAAVAALL